MITLDEAIEILSRPKTMKGTPQDILEAHDMAITALRQPEHLTDDDFETIRIHLSAFKESLCNQRRWKEAEDYERLISRFMSFASSQSKIAQNISDGDLISRKAAIDAIRASTSKYTGFMEMEMYTDDDAIEAIEALPSAQPERMRGKWIYGEDEYGIDGYHCNQCGFFVPWDYAHKFINYIEDYHFCPNCGADMKGEDDE